MSEGIEQRARRDLRDRRRPRLPGPWTWAPARSRRAGVALRPRRGRRMLYVDHDNEAAPKALLLARASSTTMSTAPTSPTSPARSDGQRRRARAWLACHPTPTHEDRRVSRYDLSRGQLAALLSDQPLVPGRLRSSTVSTSRLAEPGELTELPRELRYRLEEDPALAAAFRCAAESVADGGSTVKWLLETADGKRIETVLMRYRDRATVCVSSQAGCAMACTFCATGDAGFGRHLSSGEIVEQVVLGTRRCAAEGLGPARQRRPHGDGRAVGEFRRRVAGRGDDEPRPRARRPASHDLHRGCRAGHPKAGATKHLQVNLAVSLHAANDSLRDELVPLNRRYPIAMLMQACAEYSGRDRAGGSPSSGRASTASTTALRTRRSSPSWLGRSGLTSTSSRSTRLQVACRGALPGRLEPGSSRCGRGSETPASTRRSVRIGGDPLPRRVASWLPAACPSACPSGGPRAWPPNGGIVRHETELRRERLTNGNERELRPPSLREEHARRGRPKSSSSSSSTGPGSLSQPRACRSSTTCWRNSAGTGAWILT